MVSNQSEQAAVRRLEADQLAAFDTEYVKPHMWEAVKTDFTRSFPSGEFTLLDIGGGNGAFVDRVLEAFPGARVTLVDNAPSLLAVNKPHERKELVCEAAERLHQRFEGRRFDVVCFHWVLHHMVLEGYRKTREMQVRMLRLAPSLLVPGRGRISVFENMYQGRLLPSSSSWLIYHLTSSRLLAPLMRRGGANTAGVGVAFLDRSRWLQTFGEAGLNVDRSARFENWRLSVARRVLLNISSVYVEHFWLKAELNK